MDSPLDQTALSTIALLEARLLRLQHLLYGPAAAPPPGQPQPALRRMAELDRRFSLMLSRVRVYGELLKIYKAHPDFFRAPAPSEPPSQLSPEEIRSIVLASASAYTATLSSLTAVKDSPVPDASETAVLISLAGRIEAIRAAQMAQAAEMAGLRRRSEAVIRLWYEGSVLPGSQFMADTESRIERVEQHLRRRERAMEHEQEL